MREVNRGTDIAWRFADDLGWRLDYFIISKKFAESDAVDCGIHSSQVGSDHAPIFLKIKDQPVPKPHPTPSLSSKVLRKKQASIKSFFTKTKSTTITSNVSQTSKEDSLKRIASSTTEQQEISLKKQKLEDESETKQ